MTDNLRDRIAAVLLEDWPAPVFSTGKQLAQAQKLADAVIAELSLDIEHGCATAGHHGCRCAHRYVTEWMADD